MLSDYRERTRDRSIHNGRTMVDYILNVLIGPRKTIDSAFRHELLWSESQSFQGVL